MSRFVAVLSLLVVSLGVACGTPTSRSEPGANDTVDPSRVSSFAVRALAHSDLLDPTGDFNDYSGIADQPDGWRVEFESSKCVVTPSLEECRPVPEGSGRTMVWVAHQSNELVVRRASGPMTPTQRDALLSYSEPIDRSQQVVEWPEVVVAQGADEGRSVQAAILWTTQLGSSLELSCHVELSDDGSVVFTGQDVPFTSPTDEADRSGGITAFGVPTEVAESAQPAVVCES